MAVVVVSVLVPGDRDDAVAADAADGRLDAHQHVLDVSDAMDLEIFRARYEADRARDILLAGTHGIDEVMKAQRLDALLFPGSRGADVAARPGYPTVIVPFRHGAQRARHGVSRDVQGKTGALRRELHGHGVQRTHAAPARVRLRAGHEAEGATAGVPVGLHQAVGHRL
jgi:hypothetical protein